MHFSFLLFIMQTAMRGWFKKAYVHFDESIPENVPVIYASTHPNSVIDYMPAPINRRHPVNVLVRGDVFENKWLDKFFRSIWMLPVYRMRDGYSTINRNDASFKACWEAFDKNEHVLIFSEGICIQEKTLQPLKKGTARLALDYLFKHQGKEIYIVPTSSNYTHYRKFRASMTTFFGKPIKGSDYKELYEQNQNLAYEKLTSDITQTLKNNFIEETDFEDDSWTERALEALRLKRKDDRQPWMLEDRTVFDEEARLVEKLNSGDKNTLSQGFKEKAKRLHLNNKHEGLLTAKYGADVYFMQTIILAPIMAILAIPYLVPKLLVDWLLKNKIKDKIFHDTVVVFASGVFHLLQLIILAIVSFAVFGLAGIWPVVIWITMTLLGISLIDEFLFGLTAWKNIKHKSDFEALYNEVKQLSDS